MRRLADSRREIVRSLDSVLDGVSGCVAILRRPIVTRRLFVAFRRRDGRKLPPLPAHPYDFTGIVQKLRRLWVVDLEPLHGGHKPFFRVPFEGVENGKRFPTRLL